MNPQNSDSDFEISSYDSYDLRFWDSHGHQVIYNIYGFRKILFSSQKIRLQLYTNYSIFVTTAWLSVCFLPFIVPFLSLQYRRFLVVAPVHNYINRQFLRVCEHRFCVERIFGWREYWEEEDWDCLEVSMMMHQYICMHVLMASVLLLATTKPGTAGPVFENCKSTLHCCLCFMPIVPDPTDWLPLMCNSMFWMQSLAPKHVWP